MNSLASLQMGKAGGKKLTFLSSLHGPDSAWEPHYDVATRLPELEQFWIHGITAALYDALKLLQQNPGMQPAKWVIDGAVKLARERLQTGFETAQKPNRTNDEKIIYRRNSRDYHRWRAVLKNKNSGKSWKGAYDAASNILAGTYAGAEPGEMKRAYGKVTKDLKDPAKAFAYYSAMPETRELTGTSLVPKSAH
jgi:hypothetical protein